MDFAEIVQYLIDNKPGLTIFALCLWWLERVARMACEKRERTLLRELADCPPEPEPEPLAEKVGVIVPSVAMVALTSLLLIGCIGETTTMPAKTQLAPTQHATEAIETPTPVATPPIIEVTPSEEWVWFVVGNYTPTKMDMNIRECSRADDRCPVVGNASINEPVTFYAIVNLRDSGDVWLCLDAVFIAGNAESQCGQMVAWWLSGVEYGRVVIKDADG